MCVYIQCVCVCVCVHTVCACVYRPTIKRHTVGQACKQTTVRWTKAGRRDRQADRQKDLLAAGEHAGSVDEGNVGEQGRRARGALNCHNIN